MDVRCHSCHTVIGHMERRYLDFLERGGTPKEALESLGVTTVCCRKHFIAYPHQLTELLTIMSHRGVDVAGQDGPLKVTSKNTSNRRVSTD